MAHCLDALVDHECMNPRTCEKDASGKAGRCDTSAVCAVPQAPLQIVTVKGMSAAFLEFFSHSGCVHTPVNVSRFRTTCCHVWQRSYTICKSVSTSEPTTRISASRLAMRLGRSELPWLGTSSLPHLLARMQFLKRSCFPLFLPHSIHERSAREKISSDQVAHVLNDEVSRKYIQSLKR